MTVDCEGTLYVAAGYSRARGAGEPAVVPTGVYVITPQGRVEGCLPVPEDTITNLTFGGPDLRTLYITAGKTLYTARTRVQGWAVHRRLA
jgi:gluconolactonase